MRILLFSDLHAHAFKPYSTVLPSGINSRLQDTINIIDQVKVLAETTHVGLILFGGDLFHIRKILYTQTYNLVFDAIARLRLGHQVGILVGNHDQADRSGNVHSIYPFGAMAEVMDKIGWTTFTVGQEQVQVLSVPYFHSKEDTVAKIKSLVGVVGGNCPSMMLGHFGVSGALAGSNFVMIDKDLMELEDVCPDAFEQVFLGHYHETQQLAPNVRYIGAPMQHNWGDSGQGRGCLLWDTNTNKVDFFPLLYPQFVKMKLEELQHLPNVKVRGDFIRVVCPPGGRPANEEKIKDDMVNQLGARSFEFVEEAGERKTQVVSPYQPGMDMEEMIKSFACDNEGDLDYEMLTETGLSIYRSAVAEEKA